MNQQIFEIDMQFQDSFLHNEYAKIINTVLAIGKFSVLPIAAEIGDDYCENCVRSSPEGLEAERYRRIWVCIYAYKIL